VELAGALAEIARLSLRRDFRNIRPESARILLIEGGPTVLPTFPAPLGDKTRAALARIGVEVRTNSIVTGVDEEGVRVGDERIAAQTVLWAAGVAASPVAASLGVPLDRAGRVPVEPTLSVPGRPGVFVAGDLCAFDQDGKRLPGVAQVAIQQGAHGARNILSAIGDRPLEPFRYHDYGNMAVIGRGAAVADIFGVRAWGLLAWLIWIFLHLFWLIGFRSRIVVMTEWAWTYISLQRRARLITGGGLSPGSS
jgi:NADH:ubiquinone reductase (H+-translocating)